VIQEEAEAVRVKDELGRKSMILKEKAPRQALEGEVDAVA
jgi:hypothetical protein